MSRARLPLWSCVLAIGWGALVASADSVVLTSGLKYDGVTVVGAEEGVLRFRLRSGNVVSRSLADVRTIMLVGRDTFNEAEKLLAGGKHAEAIKAYATAAQSASGWRKALIQYRLLPVHENSGRIDQAVALWLEIADAAGATPTTLALRPKKIPPAGSTANDEAIKLLTAKVKNASNKAYVKGIRLLLVDLYERQGRLSEAQAVAAKLGATTSQATDVNGVRPVRPTGSGEVILRRASLAAKAGEHAKVVSLVKPALKEFASAELPTALQLLAQAQLGLAKAEKDAAAGRELLVAAGLNFMRVVVNFPTSEEAPDALVGAGTVNEGLNNFAAARAAYSAVIDGYAGSPAVARATAARERIKDKGP